MTTSHRSGSEGSASPRASSSFDLLHERIQRWIWEKGWNELRDVQERAIAPILDGERDVILAAATAAGKTEAAFLPICSRLVGDETRSVRALYVSPLKALINDQFGRLEDLCDDLGIPVHRWHGDVAAGSKRRVLEHPSGILLITPESLESLFVNHGTRLGTTFVELGWAVLDELHAYVGTERGRQLQSLLHRLELVLRRRVPRIGLSATLGDMGLAAEYLRPSEGERVEQVVSSEAGQEIRLQIRGYRDAAPDHEQEVADGGDHAISEHLFRVLRGADHLVFANSRTKVERFADLLRKRSDHERVPNEFLPHHGNLSKELREDVEARLKDPATPTTAVCTSTLELGIDIGRVSTIAQLDAPFSVASLRQRLGRSGRRGDAAVLRGYVREPELTASSGVLDTLRPELVQFVAMIELLIERWCEPPEVAALHLSTLVQQVMSLVAERGGVTAQLAWKSLCATGPFRAIDSKRFATLLRAMGGRDLLTQSPDGTLVLGEKGERIVNHFGFYAVFHTPEEYRLVHQGRTLGTVAFDQMLVEDLHLVFAGRRWRIVSVDVEEKLVIVEPAPGGRVPHFDPSHGGLVHDGVRRRMRDVLESGAVPPYLDREAQKMLVEARASYARLGLDEEAIVPCGKDTLVFPWRGDRVLNTIAVQLAARGLSVMVTGPALTISSTGTDVVHSHIEELIRCGVADPEQQAATVKNKAAEKYDWALDEELLCADYASRALDTKGAHTALREMQGGTGLIVCVVHRIEDAFAKFVEMPADGPLPRRTVIVPNQRIAHQLKREALRRGRADLLAGTRFVSAGILAAELLTAAGVDFLRGEEGLRPTRLRRLFEGGLDPPAFSRELVLQARGWEDALARTIGDLERAGQRPSELEQSDADQTRGLRITWEALETSAGESWSDARVLREAAERFRGDPNPPVALGSVLAFVDTRTSDVELDFLAALPTVDVVLRVGRPVRRAVRNRIRRRLGADASRAVRQASLPRGDSRDLDVLATHLFEPLDPSGGSSSPKAKGQPDGTVGLEEHAGVEAEVEAAASWVALEVLEHKTPLEEIAVLVPALDPWAGLLCERISSLPEETAGIPVVVAGGLPLASTASGTRVLAIIRALRAHLSVDALARVLPILRTPSDGPLLSAGDALELAHAVGTLGGNPSRPDGALEWASQAELREERIAAELGKLAELEEDDDRERATRGRIELERILCHLRALRPSIDELVELARVFVEARPLHECWPLVFGFLDEHVPHPPPAVPAHRTINSALQRVCSDPTCRDARGDEALALIERALLDARVPHGRFGDPAVYIGALAGASGLSFSAVRVVGLAEGSVPPLPREDPVLPNALRKRIGGGRLVTIEDESTHSLQDLDLVVRDVRERVVLSAPRVGIDGGEREASVVFLEAAAALPREGASIDLSARRRVEVEASLDRVHRVRRERPLGEAAWQDRVALSLTGLPSRWQTEAAVDPRRVAALDPGPTPMPLDGFVRDAVLPAIVPGLEADRPISASRFRTLLECPHRFLLEHVLGWSEPAAPRPQDALDALAYGSLVHRVVECFFSAHGGDFYARQGELDGWKDAAREVSQQEFETALDTYPLAGEDVRQRELARLLRDVENFLEREWKERPTSAFVASEKPFGWQQPVQLVETSLFARGFIDLIEISQGKTWIRDLKTGSCRPRSGRERDPIPRIDAQLAFYALVAHELHGPWKIPADLAVGYVYTNDARGRERSFVDDQDDFQAIARSWVNTGAQLLRNGLFPRTTDPEDCRFCPFRPVCGPRSHERAEELLADVTGPLEAFRRTRP